MGRFRFSVHGRMLMIVVRMPSLTRNRIHFMRQIHLLRTRIDKKRITQGNSPDILDVAVLDDFRINEKRHRHQRRLTGRQYLFRKDGADAGC